MLKGSEKQVSWAKRIRQERLSTWKKADPLVFHEIEPKLNGETSAAWWITHREKSLSDVLPYIVDGGSPEKKAEVKPKKTQDSAPSVPPVYSSLDDVVRFVGETRSVTTGEVVDDPDCPF